MKTFHQLNVLAFAGRAGTVQHTAQRAVGAETLRNLINAVTRLLPPATEAEVPDRTATHASAP